MCLIEDQSWIDCIDITSRWDTFVSFHLYGNKGVSLPLWPIRPRWFHTYSPCAEPLGDGHEGMWARFGSQGSIALNWHSRYSGTRYSGTWLYMYIHFMEFLDNDTRGTIMTSGWCLTNKNIPIINIRLPYDCLIYMMGNQWQLSETHLIKFTKYCILWTISIIRYHRIYFNSLKPSDPYMHG